jgi:short-subunit dehydrogenase involved in D-alanine esterification of teichoic acids
VNIDDRRILITGGTSGIGLELARRLSHTNLVVVAGRDAAKLRAAAELEPAVGTVQVDVTSEAQSQVAIASVIDRLGGIDILVNSAGIFRNVALSDAAAAQAIEAEVAVNLVGSMRMTRLALPYLEQSDDGGVVFLSSALALAASPGLASYAATKAGVHSFARSLRAERGSQLKVFDVLPPFVDTSLSAGLGGTKLRADDVAASIVDGLLRDRFEIRVGRVKALGWMTRMWPAAADRLIAGELGRTIPTAAAGVES